MATRFDVDRHLEQDADKAEQSELRLNGIVGQMIYRLSTKANNLLGFILDMTYDEATIVTCDAWKRKCGGLAKNSFVVIRLNPKIAGQWHAERPTPSLILARIIESVATPVSREVQQTIFEIHKVQAIVDPYTDADLQWGALKATILGTYYDGEQPGDIRFGADVDSYMSAHFYEVFVPEPPALETLINSFVDGSTAVKIGHIRYTETQTSALSTQIEVRVSPKDFVSNRTALFGKTRSGKSNTIKLIADMMLRAHANVGQIIFDIAAEYAYPNQQDKTAIYSLHPNRCVRYSLNPASSRLSESEPPRPLKVNFLEQVQLGHAIIASLWDSTHASRPNYYRPLLEMWEPCDSAELKARFSGDQSRSELVRYHRAESMYFAALAKAGFALPKDLRVNLHVTSEIRKELAKDSALRRVAIIQGQGGVPAYEHPGLITIDVGTETNPSLGTAHLEDEEDEEVPTSDIELSDSQPVTIAVQIYRRLHEMITSNSYNALFKASKTSGKPYFEDIHIALLRILGDTNVSGTQYLIPFRDYHALGGSHLTEDIVSLVDQGKTVIIDLSNSDEHVSRFYSTLIAQAVFKSQVGKFTRQAFANHSVLFYFEEAHNLFERDDKDLRSVYNRLAKEGAKYQIGLVYATQSMTTLSPDLLKNTENFFIAHLNDDREIRELTRHYEFRDTGADVQRTRTQGYVRMITLSHRYALPVQIEKFGPQETR